MVTLDKRAGRSWHQRLRTVAPMVVMILIVAACSSSDDDAVTTRAPAAATTQATPTTTTPIATTSSTVSPPTTSSLEAQQQALAVAEAYVAAYNTGDRDAVMGSFTSDVSISNSSQGDLTTVWPLLLAWEIAQGMILTAADCTVAEASSPGAVTVTCETGTHVPQAQLIGAPPTPTTLTFLVVPEGIRELELIYGQPGLGHTAGPFFGWLEARDPEDIGRAVFSISDSVAEAEQKGLVLAQYAEEWAAFLDASDCVYPDICYQTLTDG